MSSKFKWRSLFYQSLLNTKMEKYLADFADKLNDWDTCGNVKEKTKLSKQLASLPECNNVQLDINDIVSIASDLPLSEGERRKTISILKQFMPWRKGPFSFFDIHIKTEWRSDWKWNRVLPHIKSLKNKKVLDVGCGSGYHLFRMHQAGALQIIGIDPTSLFFYQFQCFKRYMPEQNIHFLPIGIEAMPSTQYFDCVFSMGVLYHRPDPIKFLKELKQQLAPGGQLVLETLVVEGDKTTVLVPNERYAQMSNVWFIPSVKALIVWLEKVGFEDCKCVDIGFTSTDEQQSSEWMQNQSLVDFLDPENHSLTIEGYQAPLRAVITASVASTK
ncbi:tRNA 5-methoxyuridine(34)/uridine 5-oxyacetic acid(34) synthase CmoB [Glaciecola petra]|uniref:tRNA U34 carboxymethyltransferase n=1 Tax=Glaciecola petra TaxID=3075602 RepID=A0ABU2ZPW6_9ALTE|nr:tRNA 5-methoxyuridine(34)/uridine 5-oxyacetic acid(34) synthase CmoB [Aestuariibacter sp. P117]MDT0594311.1 tRNA 5-methoxyuridine(34)/uridine 5-oxyacetic acid(34) synthase CmoB [Aestuariibacter sp. P117]